MTALEGMKHMTKKTKSEALFEEFCKEHNLDLYSIPRNSDDEKKTPDYILHAEESKIIIEIKQLDPNPKDKKRLEQLEEYGETGFMLTGFSERVRKKIKKAVPQIKARNHKDFPAVVVLFDNVYLYGGIDSDDIKVGMYGEETVDIAIPKDHRTKPFALRHRFGKNRSLAQSHNTSLSCVAVLNDHPINGLLLNIYHNDYASHPLNPDYLRLPTIRHFRLEESVTDSTFRNWVQC
jgi:hypothetical protein